VRRGPSPDGGAAERVGEGKGEQTSNAILQLSSSATDRREKSETIRERERGERERERKEKGEEKKTSERSQKGGTRGEGVVARKPGARGSLGLICQISFHAPESGRDQLDGARYRSADTYRRRILSPFSFSPFPPPRPPQALFPTPELH